MNCFHLIYQRTKKCLIVLFTLPKIYDRDVPKIYDRAEQENSIKSIDIYDKGKPDTSKYLLSERQKNSSEKTSRDFALEKKRASESKNPKIGICSGTEKDIRGRVLMKKPSLVKGLGGLSVREVSKTVSRHPIRMLNSCYDQALKGNLNLEGKLTMRFTVSASGQVTAAEATQNELSSAVEKCFTSSFTKTQFPSFEGGPLVFEYQFLLRLDC